MTNGVTGAGSKNLEIANLLGFSDTTVSDQKSWAKTLWA